MSNPAGMQQLRDVLGSLSLREGDFATGDVVVERIAALRASMFAFEASSEPWLLEWLVDEHYKGAALYAAGKMNLNHEQQGSGSLAAGQMRGRIVSRFNLWVVELANRLTQYEEGRRDAASVAGWRSEIARFKQDPIRNK